MKKLLMIAAIAFVMNSCNNSSTSSDSTKDSTKMTDDAIVKDTSTGMATAPSTTDTTMSSTKMKEDMMMMKDGKMMVMKNGSWIKMDSAMTCTNGVKVTPEGKVTKGDKKKTLTEGMMMDKDGQMMDKDGKMVDNSGW